MPRFCRRNFKVVLTSITSVIVLHYLTEGADQRPIEQRYPPHRAYLKDLKEFDDHIISDLIPHKKSESTTKSTTTSLTTTTTKSTTRFRAVAVVKAKKVTTKSTTTTTKATTTRKTLTTTQVACPKRPIVFCKTHKTASTTLTNIVLRWAEKNKYLVGLPPVKRWELGGYPAPFDPALVDPAAKDKWDVLAHHFRWSDRVLGSINPEALVVTLLRDPVKNFESVWGFFRDAPFVQWMGEDRKLADFLENPKKYYNDQTPWYYRAHNYMAFDLGLDWERDDDQYIQEAIKLMEQRFGLVLLTDFFEESLVLLKEKVCMSLDDIKSLKLKVRKDADRSALDPTHQQMIRKWNKLDSALYDHFLTVHRKAVEAYGQDKMEQELKLLEDTNKAATEKCISRYDKHDNKPWISRIVLKHNVDSLCRKMSWSEVLFGDTIRDNQKRSLRAKMKAIQKEPADLVKKLDEVQKTALTKTS